MEFIKITPHNILGLEKYLKKQPYRLSNLTLGSILNWRNYFNYEYTILDETLVIKGNKDDGVVDFLFPTGKNPRLALKTIEEYCFSNKIDFILRQVPEEALEMLKNDYDVKIKLSTNWFDYIYETEKLSTLSGKKLAAKRNHVNNFKKLYPSYEFKVVIEEDIPRLLEFMETFQQVQKSEEQIEFARYEEEMAKDAIRNIFLNHQIGGYVEVDGNIIAYTIGEILLDTLYVHIEKANREYHGSYAIINQEYAKYIFSLYPEIIYVNREEDVGDLGLRKAKQSYYPVMLLQKYTVKIEE